MPSKIRANLELGTQIVIAIAIVVVAGSAGQTTTLFRAPAHQRASDQRRRKDKCAER
jgi:hypothetical protein